MTRGSQTGRSNEGPAVPAERQLLWPQVLAALGAATALAMSFMLVLPLEVDRAGHHMVDMRGMTWVVLTVFSIIAILVIRVSPPLGALMLGVCSVGVVAVEYDYWHLLDPERTALALVSAVPWLAAAVLSVVASVGNRAALRRPVGEDT